MTAKQSGKSHPLAEYSAMSNKIRILILKEWDNRYEVGNRLNRLLP